MDGRPPGEGSIDPAGLLRSALEKIVYFECRVSQLEAELAAARQVAERARGDAAGARGRETGLATELAAERGRGAELEARGRDLAERVRLLEAERERLLGGLVERARVAGAAGLDGEAGPEEGGAELAGFIAELRAEIEALRGWRAVAEAHGLAPDGAARPGPEAPAAGLAELAGRFGAAGRTGITAADGARLAELLPAHADRVLHERAMADLAAPEPAVRRRAVRQLEALGARAAAPLLAAALGREADAGLKVAMLEALARFGEPFAAELAARQLDDARPEVRAAALEALAAVAEAAALPRLAGALADPSPLVRRRATVLLGFARGGAVEEALAGALRDADPGVARAAAAALASRPTALAQAALARALEHPDATVRRAAARPLSAWSGEAIDGDGPPGERRRASRRIAERLAAMGGDALREAVLRAPPPPRLAAAPATAPVSAPVAAAAPIAPAASTPPAALAARLAAAPARPAARAAVALLDAPAPPAPGDALDAPVLLEVRGALRGRGLAEIADALGAPAPLVAGVLERLRARGEVVARGGRWCSA